MAAGSSSSELEVSLLSLLDEEEEDEAGAFRFCPETVGVEVVDPFVKGVGRAVLTFSAPDWADEMALLAV